MFAKGLGGIEQAFVDYTKSLLISGHRTICVIRPESMIKDKLLTLKNSYQERLQIIEVSNFSKWDFFAKCRLSKIVRQEEINITICHGGRAVELLRYPTKRNKISQVAVAHNYSYKSLIKADYIFSITKNLKNFLVDKGFEEAKIKIIPNCLDVGNLTKISTRRKNNPIVLGVLSRFEERKGVHNFLKSCAALKANKVNYRAIIAGDGIDKESLQKLRDDLGLNGYVEFIGWVENKKDFYKKIDIFCLPSIQEAFGIVLLEAMHFNLPIVATKTSGPSEILEHNKDALLCEVENPGDMALKIREMIESHELADKLQNNANKKLQTKYTLSSIAGLIKNALAEISSSH